MNREFKLKQSNLWFLYYRYKDSPYLAWLIIAVVLFICITLFFQVVVPQIQEWFSIREEAIRTQERIDNTNSNIDFMSKVDRSVLDNQVKVATSALPTEKDFGMIINVLSDSSVASGVTLDDFTFQIGKVASVEGQLKFFGKTSFAFVKLTVVIKGSIDQVNQFLKEVQEKLPLAEVTDIDGDTFLTTVTLQFFQKQFPVITFKDDQPIQIISNKNISLLDKLATWQIVVPEEVPVSSGSADIPVF